MKDICYVVGAGPAADVCIPDGENRFVIAADGGLAHLEGCGVRPDLIVGDFDSLGFVPAEGEVLRFPPEKDYTDMEIAVRAGLERGYRTFVLYGGLGGRLDHSMANLQLLAALADEGAAAYLLGENTAVTVLKNGALEFDERMQGMVSVFSMGDRAVGVDEVGLKYPLQDAVIQLGMTLGTTHETLAGYHAWGERLRLFGADGGKAGLLFAFLTACECALLFLHALITLFCAGDALALSFPALKKKGLSLALCGLIAALSLSALMFFGFDPILAAGALAGLPALFALIRRPYER